MALFCSEKPSVLLKETFSKNDCEFYCLNCIHSFRMEN